MNETMNLQHFSGETQTPSAPKFDGGKYGNPLDIVSTATAGKNIIVSIWNADGSTLLAIKGQKGLKINRKADSIDISTKDTEGGWKAKLAGLKEWGLDTDGIYVLNDASHRALSAAFEDSSPVLIKVTNKKTKSDMFGGLASITDYSFEAPYDDAMTYSLSLEGMGALVDLTENTQEGNE